MTTIKWVMTIGVFIWGVWAFGLVVRQSWSNKDSTIGEMSGYVLLALAIIVALRFLLMLIGVL